MRVRWLGALAGLLVLVPVTAARAQDTAADAPSVVFRVKSLETVLQNVKLLVSLAGREEAAQQIEGLFKGKVGPKGLEGVDPNRPLGAFLRFGKELDDISGAVLIPITDEKAFLTFLENSNILFTKDNKGVYTVQTGKQFDVYFRFANKYAYVTGINADNLQDKNLVDPAKVLAGGKDDMAIAATVRLDQVPEAAKLLALAQLEQGLQDAQAKTEPKETEVQKAFRVALTKEIVRTSQNLVREGAELRLGLNVDRASKDFVTKLSIAGKPGTELAKALQKIGKTQSPFGAVLKKDVAFHGAIDLALPDPVKAAFLKVIEEARAKSLADIQDAEKRKQAEQLMDALAPTVQAGELDGFFGLVGPSGKHYTLLAGLKLQDGEKLGQTVRTLVADALKTAPAAERNKVQLDADSVGGVKIHRFELPRDAKNEKFINDLPGDPNLFVAFRKDAVLLAIGPQALPALKTAIGVTQPATTPVFLFDFDVAKMVPVLAKTQEQRDLADRLFKASDDSKIRFIVEGGPALSFRLEMKLSAVEFLAKMNPNAEQ